MENYRFYLPIEIRYGDLDPQGHVNAARYMTFVEHARIAYLHHLKLWDGGSFLNIGIILADAHFIYKAPIQWGQNIRVGTRIDRLGNKSFDMVHIIEDVEKNQILASSATTLVTYDYHADRAILIPDHWRKTITNYENLDA